jgi:hypothetical protein
MAVDEVDLIGAATLQVVAEEGVEVATGILAPWNGTICQGPLEPRGAALVAHLLRSMRRS